jgi:hypothetical protein
LASWSGGGGKIFAEGSCKVAAWKSPELILKGSFTTQLHMFIKA